MADMRETAARSAYGVMASWFTPSYLFVFINLVIGTIAIISRFANTTKRQRQRQHQLLRSPSLVDRFTSFNFCYHKHDPTTTTMLTPHNLVVDPVQSTNSSQLDRSSSLLDRVRSFSFHKIETQRPDPVQNSGSEIQATSLLDRVRSFSLGLSKVEDENPESVQEPLRRAPSIIQRLKSLTFDRSESVKESEAASEAAEVTRGGELVEERGEEEGVDAKADDFINKFRQQLRLQRLDSILRYRNMLQRN
ncbi:unnamed protein product [Sphenostylis stenocarpa]|uniref:DUF4408 domain-containing protein n=1 Tax=Sphenostylis stenocarpa TaxID=92480 RepID=A0AA86W0W7_9FABA|nr:unnamed protein product [Sphenostylis stenocarpa]